MLTMGDKGLAETVWPMSYSEKSTACTLLPIIEVREEVLHAIVIQLEQRRIKQAPLKAVEQTLGISDIS